MSYGRAVHLPVMPPVKPMLAKSVKGIPDPGKFEGGLSFEPKWDGFRCLVFRDGDEVELTSRNTKPLTRYFPEVVAAVREQLPPRCVLDGELFVAVGPRLEFEVLQERIHPAASRINMLAEQTPAAFVAFDLLALGDHALVDRPVQRAARPAGGCARGAQRSDVPHPHHDRRRRGCELVRPVRGGRARRRGGQADGGAVRRERPHHAQDQARPDRGRRGGRLPVAQELHRATAAAGLAAAGAVRRGQAAAHRRRRLVHRGAPGRAARGAAPPRGRDRAAPVGRMGRMGHRQPRPRARAPRAGGAPARTSPSHRCAPNVCSRSATSTWRAAASGTLLSSSAGDPTATPSRAATTSSRSR